jgi:hypothetical protein
MEVLTMRAATFGVIAMSLICGGVFAEESPQIQKEFQSLDRNDDGAITHEELRANPERAHQLNLGDSKDFAAADSDNNGQLDLEEFSAFEAPFDVQDD